MRCNSTNNNIYHTYSLLASSILNCNIAIVGGGPSGTYTAMQLSKKHGSDICVFEKESKVGGRLQDINEHPKCQLNDCPHISIGGRRVLPSQTKMIALANELHITLENPDTDQKELIFARGMHSTNRDDFINRYPGLPIDPIDLRIGDSAEYQVFNMLFNSAERKNIESHPNMQSYMVSVIGLVGFNYLRDMTPFKGDYQYNLSAKSYIDWLEEELRQEYDPHYPIGGMSIYVHKMAERAKGYGVRIFQSQPISLIDKDGNEGYILKSRTHSIKAKRVVIAVPPVDLPKIKGTVTNAIISQAQFKSIQGIRATTITQLFDNAWWKGINTLPPDNQTVWRAWTSDSCIASIEIPQEAYLINENIIRTVYLDQPGCIGHFEYLRGTDYSKLEEEIHDGLKYLLEDNGATSGVQISKAKKTVVKDWMGAWYWLRAGTPYSNQDISSWAIEPLTGEYVGLVSDGYNPQGTVWMKGAIESVNNLLNSQYHYKF